MQILVANLRGFRFSRRLAVGEADDYILLFQQGAGQRYAVWTTGQPHSVTLPDGRAVGLTDTPQYLGSK